MTERETTCEQCGTAHYSKDKAWTKCECGNRVWFDKNLQERFGGDTPPRAFMPDRHEQSGSSENDDDNGGFRSTTIDEYT